MAHTLRMSRPYIRYLEATTSIPRARVRRLRYLEPLREGRCTSISAVVAAAGGGPTCDRTWLRQALACGEIERRPDRTLHLAGYEPQDLAACHRHFLLTRGGLAATPDQALDRPADPDSSMSNLLVALDVAGTWYREDPATGRAVWRMGPEVMAMVERWRDQVHAELRAYLDYHPDKHDFHSARIYLAMRPTKP